MQYEKQQIIDQHLQQHGALTIWPLDLARHGHVDSPQLAALLPQLLPIDTAVADLGCGRGYYVHHLQQLGYRIDGYEGTEGINDIAHCYVYGGVDLTRPMQINGPLRNIICLEVLEHILPEQEAGFIDNIMRNLADVLVLSWAVPGQVGDGHNNCRDNQYVIDLFTGRGLTLDEAETARCRADMTDTAWLRNTLFIFRR